MNLINILDEGQGSKSRARKKGASKPNLTPLKNNSEHQDEIKVAQSQIKTIFQYLFENEATASMVAQATGIYQKNICRYKRDLEKSNRIFETKKGLCKVTGFKAWYLTTNPDRLKGSRISNSL